MAHFITMPSEKVATMKGRDKTRDLVKPRIRHGLAKYFKNDEYGTRVIFTAGLVNPRDQLGKIGVHAYNRFGALFHRTIKVKAEVQSKLGQVSTQTLHLSRESVIDYIEASGGTFIGKRSEIRDIDIVNRLNEILSTPNQNSRGMNLRHAGRYNTRSLNSLKIAVSDFLRGKFFSWLYQKTINSLTALKKRFIFAKTEHDYFEISEVLAKRRFKEALEEPVPAYQAFVNSDADFKKKKDPQFRHIPVTSKANYIQPNYDHDWDLHKKGKYPVKQAVNTSTGTTGKPAVWVRGEDEVSTVKKSLKVAVEIDSGKRHIHYINAFALGPWATGMTAYELMRETGSVIAVGPDIGKILDELDRMYRYEQNQLAIQVNAFIAKHKRLQTPEKTKTLFALINNLLDRQLDNQDTFNPAAAFDALTKDEDIARYKTSILNIVKKLNAEKVQFVVAGYPPFLKDMVDTAAAQGIDFARYHARGVVGGQAISEALRDKLIESGFTRINSSYGASDLDINLGIETDFEIQFRKILEKNHAMQVELFGPHRGLPMVFHYDPFNHHVESTDQDDLLFTCNRDDRSSPRLRYNLGDKGRVFAASVFEAILVKHGYDHIKPKINLPFICVWGRDSAVAYRGCKVAFTDLERGITNLDAQNNYVKRAFYAYQDAEGQEKFDLLIEVKDDALPSIQNCQTFARNLLIEMARLNQDLRSHLEINNNAALPRVRFFKRGASPISNSDGHRKQVLVFKNHNLPQGYQFPADEVCITVAKDEAFANEAKGIANQVQDAANNFVFPSQVGHGPGSPRFMRGQPVQQTVVTNTPSLVLSQ